RAAPQTFDEWLGREADNAQEVRPAEESQGRTEDDGEGERAFGADPPPATTAGTNDGATPARVDAGRSSGHRQGDGHHAAWGARSDRRARGARARAALRHSCGR